MGIYNNILECGCVMTQESHESSCVPYLVKRCNIHTPVIGDVISYDLKLFLLTYGEKYDKSKKYIIDAQVVKAPFVVEQDDCTYNNIILKTKYSFDVNSDKLSEVCFTLGKCKFIDGDFILFELDYYDSLVVSN
jgi:hypothetical protein